MKRAQLQAMETIIVAIVLILLVLLGLFIYVVGSEDVAEQNQRQGASEEILTLGTRLSNMMELSCSQRGRENSVCVDLVKAELLGAWLTDPQNPNYDDTIRLQYADVFGSRNITLRQKYPAPTSNQEIVLFDGLTNENYLTQFIPVVIYDPQEETYVLGELEVIG